MKHGPEDISKSRDLRRSLSGTIYRDDDPFASVFPESPEEMRIDCDAILNWDSFHSTWAKAAGLPDFYGRTMNAWIDCMSSMREDSRMTRFRLESGQVLLAILIGSGAFRRRTPEIFDALLDATTFVNARYRETGHGAALALVFV